MGSPRRWLLRTNPGVPHCMLLRTDLVRTSFSLLVEPPVAGTWSRRLGHAHLVVDFSISYLDFSMGSQAEI